MKKLLYVLVLLINFSPLVSQEDKYIEINKSFELYGEVYKMILNNYVLELSPENLSKFSIDGLLQSLDPYTEYYTDKEKKEVEMMTLGVYTGFGIVVSEYDSELIIEELAEDYSAYKNGIRRGDKLYKINNTVVINQKADSITKYTSGTAGTESTVWIIRGSDTLKKQLTHEVINQKNVPYFGFVQDSIAYISLSGFTQSATFELRGALNSLKRIRKPAGLIIDLRNNPGGLIQAAVSICEMFLKQGETVASIKGNNPEHNAEFKTILPPDNPDIKLAVLIDGMSASASECLAGAIQDLDRGVILGETSYGKGLVQEFFELPYNWQMKITTARYYTPSGRCIQKRDFADAFKNKESFIEDTNKVLDVVYKTKAGRDVIESNGIEPDSTLEKEKYSEYFLELAEQRLFFKYVNLKTNNMDSLPKDFSVNDEMLDDFKSYIVKNSSKLNTKEQTILKNLKEKAIESERDEKLIAEIDKLELLFTESWVNDFTKNKEIIKKVLDYEFKIRFISKKAVYEQMLKTDKLVQSSCKILCGKEYNKLLKIKS